MKPRFAVSLVLALMLFSSISHAGEPEKKTNTSDDGWEAVNGQMVQPGEGFKANGLVAAAYGFIWLMVAGFVMTVWMRTESVERDLERLRKQIETKQGGPGR